MDYNKHSNYNNPNRKGWNDTNKFQQRVANKKLNKQRYLSKKARYERKRIKLEKALSSLRQKRLHMPSRSHG